MSLALLTFTMGEIDLPTESAEQVFPLAISESLVPVRESKTAGTVLLSLDGLLEPPLQINEDLKDGCGGQPWPAGIVLAKYMLRKHKFDLCGKIIVELGAGSGLVGLAIARGCTVDSPIYITDQTPMLSLMQSNVQLNGLSNIVYPTVLEWGRPLPETVPSTTAIILAADCVYFEPAFPLLLSTLQSLLTSSHSLCYFCFKKRRRADLRFMKQAKKLFNLVEVKDDPDRECYSKENIFMYVITKGDVKAEEPGERK
ncbi:methyltransferase domain-containing protein [Histoplasma capsulatum G186AR]|nr:methyltransferase domain-containing protein [Histoplasma capsulatum]QSS69623.1 methyltransferase domain-containing protein [Histoplasma capsulatum G186AR]